MGWATFFGPDHFIGTAFTALPAYDGSYTQDPGNGEWRIGSNGLSAGCTVTNSARCWLVSAPPANHRCKYTIVQGGGGTGSMQREEGLLVRFNDDPGGFWGGTGYVTFIENDNKAYLYRLDGLGSHTLLTSASYTPVSLDVFMLQALGTTISVLVNGVELMSAVDATWSADSVGLWCGTSIDDTATMSVDDFTVETFTTEGYLLVKN